MNQYSKSLNLLLVIHGLVTPNIKSNFLRKLHGVIGKLFMINYVFIFILLTAKIPLLIIAGDQIYMQQISFFVTNALCFLKLRILTSNVMSGLQQDMDSTEKKVAELSDSEKEIYAKSFQSFKLIRNSVYVFFYGRLMFLFLTSGLRVYLYKNEIRESANITYDADRIQITPLWLPFESKPFFHTFYPITEVTCCIICTGFYIISNLGFLSLVIFCVGQFKVIQSVARNCHKNNYIQKTPYETARWCIQEHQNLLKFIVRIDTAFSFTMLFEAMVRSMQVALTLLHIYQLGSNYQLPFLAGFLSATLMEIVLVQWNANNITEESMNLCQAVYDSEWYSLDRNTKFLLLTMMTRCQRPMYLHIGPLGNMSNELTVKIMKYVYTCITVMNQFR